jgi:predicted DNA-binding protein
MSARTTEVAVEPGRRGTGLRLTDQTTIGVDKETGNILRIMKANTGRSVGDILREAALGKGLSKVEGYDLARSQYRNGRRITKPPATGGTPRTGVSADPA